MPFAEVNGVRLYYAEHGEGEPLILVMGLGADHLSWAFQLGPFSERFRTIVFDNRDAGRSTRPEADYALADMAQDILALADHLELESFHLLGLSMGSAISQHVALAAPERVKTLTLAASWAGASDAYGAMRTAAWERDVHNSTPEEWLEVMMTLTLSERFFATPGAVEQFKRLALAAPHPQPPEAFVRQARASAGHDVRDRLHELTMPVHVISGAQDILIPAWKQRELAELIRGAELTVLEDAAHSMHLETAEAFNRAVLEFLGARAPSA